MTLHTLRLFEDTVSPGNTLSTHLFSKNTIVYLVEGSVALRHEDQEDRVMANNSWFVTDHRFHNNGNALVRMWRWDLVSDFSKHEGVAAGDGVTSTLKLSNKVELQSSENYLMRCDRVDFPLGGIAYTHTHGGPGTRCLLTGQLTVKVGGVSEVMSVGEPWFEIGHDPVYAEASAAMTTSFIHVMILPELFQDNPSIKYILSEDEGKPKTQQYTRFVDNLIEL